MKKTNATTLWDMGGGIKLLIIITNRPYMIYDLLFYSPNELGETTLDAMFMDA